MYPEDARDLLDHLAEALIARVYLLFPDPWHKARHHRRDRMVRGTANQCPVWLMLPNATSESVSHDTRKDRAEC
ncbi:MAG: hypothetical protein ACYTG0_29730 [Planctomycetota bacterium]